MLKTDREPDLTMTNAWLAQMYDEENQGCRGRHPEHITLGNWKCR